MNVAKLPLFSLFLLLLVSLMNVGCEPSIPENLEAAYAELPEKIDFNLHIRPILSDRCWSCHGMDEAGRQAGLRLDEETAAFAPLTESSGYALVRGSLRKSEVYHRIISEEKEYMMPPPESHLTLNESEKAMLIKWIEQGAEWKDHWAFIAPKKSVVPTIENKEWPINNEIDNFVRTKLVDKQLTPSKTADKERLLRRLHMDLTGLPPSVAEIDAFLSDNSPNAYEKVVDRLLATDAHAERLAMEWMDLARYADSHGMHADGARLMWPWRDWVIQAFKENQPYDEFVTWQLAGDLLPNATREQKLATAFNRNHAMTAEGGAVDEEFRLEYVFDRSNTAATAFLGITMECARCHDHKFDPFSQEEFYQLAAFFNNVKELGMTGDDGNYGPMLTLPDAETEAKLAEITEKIQAKEKQLALTKTQLEEQGAFIKQLIANTKRPKGMVGYFPFDKMQERTNKQKRKIKAFDNNSRCTSNGAPQLVEGKKGKAVTFPAGYDEVYLNKMGLFEMTEPFSVGAWIYTTQADDKKTQVIVGNAGEKNSFWRGWDFYLDNNNRLAARLINCLPHNYIHRRTTESIPLNTWTHIAFSYDGSGKASGIELYINGLKTAQEVAFDRLSKSILPVRAGNHELESRPLRVGKSYRAFTGEEGIFKGRLDELTIFDRRLSPLEMTWLAEVEAVPNEEDLLKAHQIANQSPVKSIERSLQQLRAKQMQLLTPVMEVMVMEETPEVRPMHLLNRGVYDQPQHEVAMGTPTKIGAFSEEFPQNRLGLAQWIFDEANPLTARVAVNRYWQMIFGKGLVTTPQDFGSQGALPTHPELLDYLAVEFQESGWDLRALLKKMVLSHTYQQSSIMTAEHQELDPLNQWLARSSSYRLPAEMIRDNALAASGLLVKKVGGESVKPYQPEGLWIDLGNFSHELLRYKEDVGEKLYRRSLYTFIRRTSPPPFMTTFDVSSRDKCSVQREQTNTPLQALVLLNDPQFVEAARVLAVRMQKEGGETLADQITFAFRSTTGRKPSEQEVGLLTELFEQEKMRFGQSAKAAKEVLEVGQFPLDKSVNRTTTAALAVVANTILNHDEAYMRR
ncbi:MAG: DUF1553 domain-containing protein [Bacteroidota bacterium]